MRRSLLLSRPVDTNPDTDLTQSLYEPYSETASGRHRASGVRNRCVQSLMKTAARERRISNSRKEAHSPRLSHSHKTERLAKCKSRPFTGANASSDARDDYQQPRDEVPSGKWLELGVAHSPGT